MIRKTQSAMFIEIASIYSRLATLDNMRSGSPIIFGHNNLLQNLEITGQFGQTLLIIASYICISMLLREDGFHSACLFRLLSSHPRGRTCSDKAFYLGMDLKVALGSSQSSYPHQVPVVARFMASPISPIMAQSS